MGTYHDVKIFRHYTGSSLMYGEKHIHELIGTAPLSRRDEVMAAILEKNHEFAERGLPVRLYYIIDGGSVRVFNDKEPINFPVVNTNG